MMCHSCPGGLWCHYTLFYRPNGSDNLGWHLVVKVWTPHWFGVRLFIKPDWQVSHWSKPRSDGKRSFVQVFICYQTSSLMSFLHMKDSIFFQNWMNIVECPAQESSSSSSSQPLLTTSDFIFCSWADVAFFPFSWGGTSSSVKHTG